MPGDAFFHAELTGAFLDRLPADGGNLILSYSHPLDSAAFGGFAGFERLEIKGVTPRMVSSLRSRYAELRLRDAKVVRIDVDTKGNEVATETNGFHLFVYNRDVSWAEQRIGNKYNENWMNLPPQAVTPARSRPSGFARAPAVRYVSFLSSYEGAVDDWKNAGRFPELRARVPNGIPWGLSGPVIVEPVSIDAKDIQLVVCPYEDLLLYFQQDEDLEFFTISADGDKRFVWTEEGLMGEQIRGPEARGTTPSAGERGKGERGKGQASP
jgi:hypothetical protein